MLKLELSERAKKICHHRGAHAFLLGKLWPCPYMTEPYAAAWFSEWLRQCEAAIDRAVDNGDRVAAARLSRYKLVWWHNWKNRLGPFAGVDK